ncbi:hypothetical protein GCM10010329_51670 [Streptomyces spiroverticillatus]|uniref:CBM6 domain-containing protein n=1 Tax=Streptomyces finlayi TaxID=67296 RepID=A0A918X1S3_9ACTN|nr:CBM35 domain-containing protein [Streptomyces finlayi]GHA22023.1 hypothetical protein GCM10010329_51670 [Streptomyces spiroverticillatus]GHD04156.1 hypothetical protein GCM10010334_52610 [Streptomyces finlayi]
MTRSRTTLLAALTLLASLAPLAPLGGAPAAADETARVQPLTIQDPGFELGGAAWQFTSGTGTATNNPHSGKQLAYLDAGRGHKVSQTVTATGRGGAYVVTAWIATGGAGATYTLRVNGTTAATQTLPAAANYRRHTLGSISLSPGDKLEIAFESGQGWVNVDDVMVSPAAPARPKVTSSDPQVAEMFAWATKKANSWVHLPGTEGPLNADERQTGGTGTGVYGPSYWAGYANRSGYYSRDMAHQLAGAGVLGLHAENKAMLRAFAATATPEHRYYPVWALNFDNRTPLSIDYRNPDLFVREVPAVFELVQKAEEAYRWSGDRSYLDDPALWDFYRHATEEFVTLHDEQKDNGPRAKVAEGTGKGIFQGVASYNEQSDEPLAESGDAIGSQYQAYRAMAALARAKGDGKVAAAFDRRARDLKAYFNSSWSGEGSGADMVRGYTTDGRALTGWGKENSWFMPMKQIVAPGARREAYLDFVDAQAEGPDRPTNIEALSYLPDTFFTNNRPDTAWKWMRHVYAQKDIQHVNTRQGTNGDYPEVSFTLVGQTVEGLMGVRPDAPARTLTTQSRLPSGMGWLKIEDLSIGDSAFALRHDTARRSTLTHTTGTRAYTWEARFPGKHRTLKVDGMVKPARTEVVDGVTYSSVRTRVAPGRTVSVEVVR